MRLRPFRPAQDHFDRTSCIPDRNGILRPNPQTWTAEIGAACPGLSQALCL